MKHRLILKVFPCKLFVNTLMALGEEFCSKLLKSRICESKRKTIMLLTGGTHLFYMKSFLLNLKSEKANKSENKLKSFEIKV